MISTNLIHYVAMLTLATGCAMAVDTLYMTLMQENVPDEQRGRAMGAWTLSIGVAPAGHLGPGWAGRRCWGSTRAVCKRVRAGGGQPDHGGNAAEYQAAGMRDCVSLVDSVFTLTLALSLRERGLYIL